jgi:hypothetical protein
VSAAAATPAEAVNTNDNSREINTDLGIQLFLFSPYVFDYRKEFKNNKVIHD